MALHLAERGSHEQLEAHHRRYGIPREPKPWDIVQHAEGEGSAGPHLHLPEPLLAAQRCEHVSRVIEIADRYPRRCEDEIGITRLLELSSERGFGIGSDPQVNWHAAGDARERIESVTVGRDDSSRGDHLVE